MKILEKTAQGNVLRLLVGSNEETFFSLLKFYLEKEDEVDIVGLYKSHHLLDETEFFLKTKKGNAFDFFKKSLKKVKKELESRKLK
jgi:DNA-directed RNA polymerase subunit L